ncbi:MAG: aminotransferase class V-fold PLP-dependent enzyme [Bacteroidota bacterium]
MTREDLALFNELVEYLLQEEQNQPVAKPIPPQQLYEKLDLSLSSKGIDTEGLSAALKDLLRYTPKTASKLFFNQLFGGRNSRAVLGDLLVVLLNNSMYTYKVAGPMVGVEKIIIHQLNQMLGYPNTAGGTIATGGSMTNYMAMLMARDTFDPNIRTKGYRKPLIAYTSADSHYSIPKNAAFMGIGREQVRLVPTDKRGVMMVSELERQIKTDLAAGLAPFFVNATAGTTVLGAFDPIRPISAVCKNYGLWLHVDGAYCGSVLFSKKYRHLIDGVELTDSFSVNAHKMLGTPLTCSLIMTQDKKHLYDSFSNEASYLYQTDGDDFNLGKTSLQCGRRNDALKLWTLWKSVGTKGLAAAVDQQFHLAEVARDYIRQHPDYTLYSYEDSISVCFNYKGIPADQLCTMLYEKSAIMVGFGSHANQQFVRLVTINYGNSAEDILYFFKTLEQFAAVYQGELVA